MAGRFADFDVDERPSTLTSHPSLPAGLNIHRDVPLAALTTLGVGGDAKYFAEAHGVPGLARLIQFAQRHRLPWVMLGAGSNVVVSDQGYPGLVIQYIPEGPPLLWEPGDSVWVDAGADWDSVVLESVDRGLWGLECLSGIPGRMGAAPIQNIGAWGQELSDTLIEVSAWDAEAHQLATIAAADCGFGYRTSRFRLAEAGRWVITACRLQLSPHARAPVAYEEVRRALQLSEGQEPSHPMQVRQAVLQLRAQRSMLLEAGDPNSRSAGSFFVNPVVEAAHADRIAAQAGRPMPRFAVPDGRVKLAAAWLIEEAGFRRGHIDGAAGLSSRHALALINRGDASTQDLVRLAWRIHLTVLETFGVRLHAEPQLVGELAADQARAAGMFDRAGTPAASA
jgi:UDP-N-acetylmuramate dehydrogenase